MAIFLLAGGSGLIGSELAEALVKRGDQVIILTRGSRNQPAATAGKEGSIRYAAWDPAAGRIDEESVAQADYIVNLAGAGVADKRWTAGRKREIRESRTGSADMLVRALRDLPNRVRAVISLSAIGWYGPDPAAGARHPFVETDPAATDFLGRTCTDWEAHIRPVSELPGKRLVILRTGIVLTARGGALAEFRKPLRAGVATILGTGSQVISWIHVQDLVRMIRYAAEQESVEGVYNAVAPGPVSNRELVLELARARKGRFFVPVYVPAWLLRLVLGEMSIEVLKSATVSCGRIREAGFTFLFPSIQSAIRQLESAPPETPAAGPHD
ncbi:MAG TPA: TIGR01777 family oxidoreductase [Chitinophagaceae bacterium]|nr:TIGR01777 family oxidoreductase [Chitinophagaceae bacterium]